MFHRSGYRLDPTSDPSNSELTVETTDAGSSPAGDVSVGTPTTVRGHSALRVTLTDEGHVYGVGFTWQERPGLTITVRAAQPLGEPDARLTAEGVRPVADDTWHKLVVGTNPVAVADGTVTPDMQRVKVATGTIGQDQWVLTGLLPAGYPLVAEDRRAACFELAFRGQTSNGTSCIGHPSWLRLGQQIFAVGEVPPDVSRVRVAPDVGAATELDTAAVPQWSATRFWVAPLPEGTCQVTIEPTSGSQFGRGFGPTGPLDDPGTEPDWARCAAQASASQPTTPGASSASSLPFPPPNNPAPN